MDDLKDSLQPDILEGVKDEYFYKIYKPEYKNGKKYVPLKEITSKKELE